jgi:CheY-like chemotaxis protein
MSAIVGLARLVGTRISDEQSLGHLDKLQKASRHLLRIVNDVLDLSKIEAGQLKLESTAFEPREMLDDALGMLLEKAVAKGLTIELQVDPDVPQRMLGDPMRLQQILLNFLSNAIKFTAHGTIRVHAQAAERLDARILMRIEVQDAGIGMTAQEQERIFQPFSQADGSIARRFGGTGLGLVIARRLAELMEGEVGVHSAAGLGSTFWMTAWLHRSNAEHGWTPSRAMPLATVARTYKGFRLLLAEDNPVNQLVMSETLKNLEFEIDIVDNGLDAVERVRQCRYALVLMDMQMPLMDGLTATRAIRRMPGNERLPIFAMTANAFDDDRQRCMEAGMNEHLIKPVDIDQLEQTIARWLLSPSQGTSID